MVSFKREGKVGKRGGEEKVVGWCKGFFFPPFFSFGLIG